MADDGRWVEADVPFVIVPEQLLYDPLISPPAKLVYCVLARHGTDPTNCYPSHGRIAGLMGCSQRSVQGWVGELVKTGWVELTSRFDASGARSSNGYRLSWAVDNQGGYALASAGGARHTARGVRAPQRDEREPLNETTKRSRAAIAALRGEPHSPVDNPSAAAAVNRELSMRKHATALSVPPDPDAVEKVRELKGELEPDG